MPRRSRPSYRLPPNKGKKEGQLENVLSKPKRPKTQFVEKAADEARFDEDPSEEDFEEGSSQQSEEELGVSDDEEFDADAPRVAVWEEDDEEFLAQQDVEDNKTSDEVCVPVLVFLQPQAYAMKYFYRIGCRMVGMPTFL